MYHVSAQGVDERMRNVHYHYYYYYLTPKASYFLCVGEGGGGGGGGGSTGQLFVFGCCFRTLAVILFQILFVHTSSACEPVWPSGKALGW